MEIVGLGEYAAVNIQNHVAFSQVALFCGTVVGQRFNQNTFCLRKSYCSGKNGIDLFNSYADVPPYRLAKLQNIRHHITRKIGGYCKSVSLKYAGLCCDGRVDADEFTFNVDQCSAAVTWIDHCIGLNKALHSVLITDNVNLTAQCAHDPGGDR